MKVKKKPNIIKPDIEIGTKLFLKPESCIATQPDLELVTILESVTDDGHIVLYTPIHKNTVYPLAVGENVFIHFFETKKGRADFQCVVTERFIVNGIHYVKASAVSNIAVTQRREFFRIKAFLAGTLSAKIQSDEETEPLKYACVCLDISGGGAAIALDVPELLVGDHIELSLPVGCDNQIECYLAEVRWRNNPDRGVYKLLAGVQFYCLDKQQQDTVLKYVYRLQQDLIKKRHVN